MQQQDQANIKSPHDIQSKHHKQFSNCFMKPSLSMNALPPDGVREGSELSPARLRVDRPYNSLKKKRDCDKSMWRRSWESGHSHSSCSLQSSTTNALSGTGKDDFWAALQTNYNYIMDTNLLDSCREARGELEGIVALEPKILECCQKSICHSSRSQGSPVGDPRRLRRWLREMENRISKTPSWLEAMKLRTSDLEKLIGQHSVLHRDIASQARAVTNCIRTSEKENYIEDQQLDSLKDTSIESNGSANDKNDEKTISPSGSRRSESGLKGLERRYHLLYLRSIEVQCMLENILESHQTSATSSKTDTDEEPAAKLARLSDAEFSDRYDGNDSNIVWKDTRDHHIITEEFLAQETGFEADTEFSDHEGKQTSLNLPGGSGTTSALPSSSIVAQGMETDACQTTGTLLTSSPIQTSKTSSLVISPKIIDTVVKRPKKTADISKFNKSNRKSKNCAIFYFKHMDTDTENNNGVTGSEATKSDISSDGEWYFTSMNEQLVKELDSEGNDITDGIVQRNKLLNARSMDFNLESATDIANGNLPNEYLKHCEILDTNSVDVTMKQESGTESRQTGKRYSTSVFSTESIQKLVLGAETLVEDAFKSSPKHNKNLINDLKMSTNTSTPTNSCKKTGNSKNKKVQEWLEHQPEETASPDLMLFVSSTDCEASGEYTDSDNVSRDTDTSEEVTDSVATCLKGEINSEQGTSTDMCDSAEVIIDAKNETYSFMAPAQKTKVMMRNIKRSSDRPWSVSCISQLTCISPEHEGDGVLNSKQNHTQPDVSNFSISESAINTLYHYPQSPKTTIKHSDSKNSLKRRRLRTKKRTDSKRYDSGSEDLTFFHKNGKGLSKSESFSGKVNCSDDTNTAFPFISMTRSYQATSSTKKDSSDEKSSMMQPNFRIGDVTKVYGLPPSNSLNLGSLAALADYNKENINKDGQGTEENSSFSEQAWDSYQEKYLSEPYSEDRDTDAARRLLEFGDDYRNYLDSQSDNCSSLSANFSANIDSLSPPGHRKNVVHIKKAGSVTPESSLELRMRRAMELPATERRRKNSGKSDERRRSWITNDDSDKSGRKADTVSTGRKFSESDTSSRRRSTRSGILLRSISHQTTSSSYSDISDDDAEVKNLLQTTQDRLEKTKGLRIHSHLLRPEDYKEIISTCRDNIVCLEAILCGPPGTVLSDARCLATKDLLASWENLSKWSENAAIASRLQEEMRILKTNIEKLGTKCTNLDNQAAIKEIIDELRNDKVQMQTYRSSMLTLNATVHHWLTQQELNMNKMTTESVEVKTRTTLVQNLVAGQQEVILSETEHVNSEKGSQIDSYQYDANLHRQMKDDVAGLYAIWDETNERIQSKLENLEASLIIWKQFENGLLQFQDTLGKDRGALAGLRGALETGESTADELISNVQQVAKLLSEKIDNSIQISSDNILYLDPITAVLSSSDHLSDSGISDGDGGLSERERRLGALRRLAKQLENSLAPGSQALKTITQRMEAAEQELRALQQTCRELIIKTAVAQDPSLENLTLDSNTPINVQIPVITIKSKNKRSPLSKRKNKRRSPNNTLVKSSHKSNMLSNHHTSGEQLYEGETDSKVDSTDSEIPISCVGEDDEKNNNSKRWMSRIMSIAVPVQIAIITLFFATCLMEPHCCDSLNNFSMSFAPQLRYIKGPPPI